MSIICKNCNQKATDNFCAHCGQPTRTKRVNFHYLMHDLFHGVLHIDKGFFYTMKELTIRPGKSIREYLEGKRANHFKPFAYIFLLSTIYVFVVHILNLSIIDVEVQGQAPQDPEDIKIVTTLNKFYSFSENYFAILCVLVLPAWALSGRIVFRKSGYNYGEHFVLWAYTNGQSTLLSIILIPLIYILPKSNVSNINILPSAVLYFYITMSFFTQYSIVKRFMYALLNILILFLVIAALIITGAFIYFAVVII